MTIEELSNFSGLSDKRILAIESGNVEPTGDEILILSDIYREDFNFFISNEKLSASETVEELYRKNGDGISAKDKRLIQQFISNCVNEQYVWDCLNIKSSVFNTPYINTSYFKKEDGRKIASTLRNFLGYKDSQCIANLYSDFRKIGLHIFRMKLESSNISGLYIWHPVAHGCILINYSDNIYRQNFTLCHECGHALMDRRNFNISMKSESDKEKFREFRANAFAAEFLMPLVIIKKINKNSLNENTIIKQAARFKVNVQSYLYSLKEAGVITYNEYANLNMMSYKIPIRDQVDYELGELTQRISDAYETLFDLGLTPSFVKNCHEAYLQGFITLERLTEMLDTTIYELPDILDLFKLKIKNETF